MILEFLNRTIKGFEDDLERQGFITPDALQTWASTVQLKKYYEEKESAEKQDEAGSSNTVEIFSFFR